MQIAKNGIGTTRPNPSVGAVIVCNNKVIGEGFTSPYGGNHAEVNAINSVKNEQLLKDSTLYVTLEPCAHFGKTPPCANLIIEKQLKKVVIGCIDSNDLVAGKGVKKLQSAGIEVVVGVLENECKNHHRRFFTTQHYKRPYIILKWAQSKDGFIAPTSKNGQKPVWISNLFSQQLVHKWRSEEHAILVGTNTVLEDNPSLTVRSWKGQNPVRVVLDNQLKLPKNLAVFDENIKTIVIHSDKKQPPKSTTNIIFKAIDFSKNIGIQVCNVLYKQQIQSIIIEGGTQTLQTFINKNLWDEARVFEGDLTLIDGVKSPKITGILESEAQIKNDFLRIYKKV